MNKGIKQLTPEEVLSLTRRASESFFVDSQVPGIFDFEGYCKRMEDMIALDMGVVFAYLKDNEAIGIIGGIFYPDLFTGDMVGMEVFWYVLPEHRQSPIGIKLLAALEKYACDKNCKRLYVGNLKALNDDKMHRLYERLHFKEIETHYSKQLQP